MAIDNQTVPYSENWRGNSSFDKDLQVNVSLPVGYDGENLVKQEAGDQQIKIVESGGYTYVCKSAVGTAEATAKWKVFRVNDSGVMYADANSEYDNIATDPTLLSYAYS